ncbi:hypothetical protein [Allorhizocola rhizosphaerae]|uniref:PheS-related mystery ligase SrmL n=1 Tax=Allorhizocola rhizosphaerae TaxID=1872709 RepID=UPI000E3D4E11|nr:hypothetical protein [Allorhizocola rhizosphaerae]
MRHLRDLTDPAAGPHALQLIVDALCAPWPVPVVRDGGPAVVSVADNYDRLLYPPDAVTRERRYSHYLGDGLMLRSHTTARVPYLLHRVRDEVVLAVPGMCYRRDVIDRQHVGNPHQMDLWWVNPHGDVPSLEQMIDMAVRAVLPESRWRTVRNVHPYTLEGREIYVDDVEIGECGLAHPRVLAEAGLPTTARGLAMGLGLDRLLMLRKGITDIRLLRDPDPRVAAQMLDLSHYREVSSMPPVRRDLSLAIASDIDVSLIGDRLRALDVEAIEEVVVLSETPYERLPEAAHRRMGMRPGQKNVLLRLVLRHPSRTLSDREANALRDTVYEALHEGGSKELALAK